ncbi:MAG TPA: stalk domain-containing protein [Syntrophomonadaceae bacterium]|nr:stalk domain-containing protein [Syntrophomonadaceae bacterium]
MKRFCLILLMVWALCVIPSPVGAATDIKIDMDGYKLSSDIAPAIIADRTLVPFRSIAEAMQVQVEWVNETRQIEASNSNTKVILTIDSNTAYINGTPVSLDVAPQIVNNRTLIPLRFFSQAFACKVDWDGVSRTVKIKTPAKSMQVVAYYALGDEKTSSWTNLFGTTYPTTSIGHTTIISDLALGWYSLDENGQLLTKSRTGWQRPTGWENVLAAASKYNIKSEMVIHMTNEGRLINSLLNNPSSVNTAVKQIVTEARKYAGVNLDMEGLGLSEKGSDLVKVQTSFSAFVKVLADELHKEGKSLSLSLHAPNSSYKGYDYAALGKYSDYIIIMAYDYGPKIEPDHKVDEAITMALKNVPAGKLILGISTPKENAESLDTKVGLAKRYNLKGIAIWRLGLVTNDMWDILASNIRP